MKTGLPKSPPFICALILFIFSGCGTSAVEPTLTPVVVDTFTPTLAPTETLEPTITLTPTKTLTPTSTPDIVVIQKYDRLLAWVDMFASEKAIPSTEGEYYPLNDYSCFINRFV